MKEKTKRKNTPHNKGELLYLKYEDSACELNIPILHEDDFDISMSIDDLLNIDPFLDLDDETN